MIVSVTDSGDMNTPCLRTTKRGFTGGWMDVDIARGANCESAARHLSVEPYLSV